MNRGRRAKDAEVAEVTVDMQTLKSGSETEDWYHLTGVTPIGKYFPPATIGASRVVWSRLNRSL